VNPAQQGWVEVVAATGIFGGTFDPVHYGHLRAALEARELLALEDFRLLPAGNPPHRAETMASAEDRLAMLDRVVATYPEFQVDDREIRREGRSYMVDTLEEIRAEAGKAPLLLIIGQDAANALDSWHDWRSLFELAHLVIMRRPETRLAWTGELREQMTARLVKEPHKLHASPFGAVLPLQVTQLAISSTDIRKRLQAGHSPRFLMPDCVIDYIEQNQLYFAGQAMKG
jgi:nicotinate-nucleotide adenylyltransferase